MKLNETLRYERPEISIGIPMYRNDRRTLMSISSAIAQNESVKRVIISDDGQNQSLGKLFCSLDSRVMYKQNINAFGMWRNFVETFKLSSTRYFGWLGDDDFISPSFSSNIARAIENHPNCIAWMGLPNSHTINWGTKTGGLMLPRQSVNPYSRVLDIFAQGKYGAFFYSVFDTQKVSIYPLERLLSWPYHQFSYDYIWMINLAIQGNIFQDSSLLYFYDQTNWSYPYQQNPSCPKEEDRLSVPLTYMAGALLAMKCYLDRNYESGYRKNNYKQRFIVKYWTKIISMLISKYLLRCLRTNELEYVKSSNLTLLEFLNYSANLADHDHSKETRAVSFWDEIIKEVNQYSLLTFILSQPMETYYSWIWNKHPDLPLDLKKIKNLLQTMFGSRFSFGLWSD